MARQIIILTQDASHAPDVRFQAAFWLTVGASRQAFYANAQFTSAVRDGSVSAGELTSLQTGAIVEVIRQFGYPAGTTLPAIEADLQAQFTALQTSFTNQSGDFAAQTLTRYGSFYDGSTWTLKAN